MELYNLIMNIKKRPKMYIKEEKIEYIYYLLSGYCAAKKEQNGIEHKFMLWFSKWLDLWIEENTDPNYIPQSCFWYDAIKVIGHNEKECDLFYRLVDLFYDDYTNQRGYFCK